MSFDKLAVSMKYEERSQALLGALVVGLPALSYPLSWFPRPWAHFRFDYVVPWPEFVLAAGLLVSGACLLRKRAGTETYGEGGAATIAPWRVGLPLLAVVLSGIVSIRFSEHSHLGLALLPRLAGNLAILLLAVHAPSHRVAGWCQCWTIAALMVAANGLIRLRSEPEFVSTLGNRNFLGAYLAASVVIAMSIGGRWRVLGSLVLLAAMCFCRSRGAWLALGVVAVLWFLGWGDRFVHRPQARAIVTLSILAIAGLLVRPYILRQWQTDVRPMIWKATLRMIGVRPILGHGLGTYVAEYPPYRLPEYFLRPKATNATDHAHNELLEVAAEQGLIGLSATLWLWATALGSGLRRCRRSSDFDRRVILGLLGATAVLIVHGLVDVDLRYLPNQSLLWLLMGILVGTDAAPARWAEITIHTTPARWCAAAACLGLGVWVTGAAVIRPMAADWRDRQARIAEENGDLNAAAQRAWDALRLEPFRLSTRYFLAGVLSRLPDAQGSRRAIDQCLRIEELAPDYADVTYNLGQLYLAAGRAPQALPYLRRAVESNPYGPDQRVTLAAALYSLGQNDEAARELDRVLGVQPDRRDARELRQIIREQQTP